MSTQQAVFQMEKNDVFALDKTFARIHVGTFWDRASSGPAHDVDVHAALLVYRRDDPNSPMMFGQGSHFLTYANTTLQPVIEDGTKVGFETADGSMFHSVDNRKGGDSGMEHEEHHEEGEAISEELTLHLDKLPAAAREIAIWLTIHKAAERGLDFSKIKDLMVEVCDPSDTQLCSYAPKGEFAGKTALQVASLVKQPDGSWSFHAIGAGSNATLGKIIEAYS